MPSLSPELLGLLALPVVGYALLILAVAAHTARRRGPAPEPEHPLPRIAVLVAARNEEERLPRCLDALLAQDYPAGLLDILVADDHSTDATAAVIERYRARTEAAIPAGIDEDDEPAERVLPSVRRVVVPDPEGELRGKAHAIHAAVEACDHDLLLVTDADCAPPPDWARNLVRYFDDPEVGMVCGQTYVEAEGRHGGWLSELQALDWQFLLSATSFLVETGRPVTAMGNNMAFRRETYEAVGGYPALPFSVTEDYMLFKAVYEQTAYRLRFPADPALRNYTLPLTRLTDVYQQRRRWARGGLRARPWVYATYGVVHLAHLIPLALLLAAPALGLGLLGLKAGANFALLWAALGPSGRRAYLRTFPAFEAYFTIYVITLPLVLLFFPRINWKDRKL